MADHFPNVKLIHVRAACEDCSVRRLCLPVSLDGDALTLMDRLVQTRNPLKKGEHLYHAGQEFKSLFAVKAGAIKTYGLTADGREQITGFHLAGELVGMDAIDATVHPCSAVALESTEVCELPFDRLEKAQQELPVLQHELARIMSREILREQHMLMLLGSTSAEQRLARFLLNMSERMQARGGASNEVRLCMTRQDVGNYLGLALETVSRQLAHLQDSGAISIQNKVITLLDAGQLQKIAS